MAFSYETLKPQVEGSETPDAGGEAEKGLAKSTGQLG